MIEPFQRQREMSAAFILHHGVDLIDNQGLSCLKEVPAARRRKQDVKRLRRGDQNMWRSAHHQLSFASRRIARPDGDANGRQQNPLPSCQIIDLRQRRLEIPGNVVAERFEW